MDHAIDLDPTLWLKDLPFDRVDRLHHQINLVWFDSPAVFRTGTGIQDGHFISLHLFVEFHSIQTLFGRGHCLLMSQFLGGFNETSAVKGHNLFINPEGLLGGVEM